MQIWMNGGGKNQKNNSIHIHIHTFLSHLTTPTQPPHPPSSFPPPFLPPTTPNLNLQPPTKQNHPYPPHNVLIFMTSHLIFFLGGFFRLGSACFVFVLSSEGEREGVRGKGERGREAGLGGGWIGDGWMDGWMSG